MFKKIFCIALFFLLAMAVAPKNITVQQPNNVAQPVSNVETKRPVVIRPVVREVILIKPKKKAKPVVSNTFKTTDKRVFWLNKVCYKQEGKLVCDFLSRKQVTMTRWCDFDMGKAPTILLEDDFNDVIKVKNSRFNSTEVKLRFKSIDDCNAAWNNLMTKRRDD